MKKAKDDDDAGLSALSGTGNRKGNRLNGQKSNKVHPDQAALLATANTVSTSWDTCECAKILHENGMHGESNLHRFLL